MNERAQTDCQGMTREKWAANVRAGNGYSCYYKQPSDQVADYATQDEIEQVIAELKAIYKVLGAY